MSMVGTFVMPGYALVLDDEDNDVDIPRRNVLGPGLIEDGESIIAIKPGILRKRSPGIYWIDSEQKRYVAAKGDGVIGLITNASGDTFRVDIGTSEPAALSYLAFEGSTKRNRPNVKIGDLVYARLLVANKGIEPELVCIDGKGRSSGFGVLQDGGFLIHTSCTLARRLLEPENNVLRSIGNSTSAAAYEVTIGLNGRIWVKGRSVKETLELANIISQAQYLSRAQLKTLAKKLNSVCR